jgi:WD40 repeat protein
MLVFFVLLAAAVTGPFIAARWTARGAKKIEADFFYQLALQKLSSEEPSSEGLAYLARTIRLDRGNAAARTLLYEQLVTQPWPVPIRTFGPDGHIASAAFSGDGARVAFRVGQTIEMWDVVKGQRIGKLNAGFEPASIEFGRDGWTLMLDSYSSGPANQPVLWNPGMGRPVTFEDVRRLGCAHPQVFDVSANGSELALGCDGRLTIASLRKERPMEILPALGPRRGSGFAPDSRFIVFVYSFFAVVILDRQRPEDATTRHDSQSLTAVDFSRDSKRVVITHRRDNSVEVRDLESWRTIGRAFNNQSPPRSAIFDRTGSVLMTTADDDGIRLWNVEEGRMLFDPLRHPPLRDAGFSPDGVRMFTASDRTARWWNARDGARLGLPVVQPIMLAAHLDPLGNIVSVSTAASVWQLAPPVLPPALAEIVGKEKIDFSDDRTTAVVQDRQNRMAAFDAASGKRRWTAPAGSNILAFDSHAARAMILDADGVLSLVDTRTWKCLWRRTGHASSQTKCSFSGDGSVVILAEDIRHTGKPSRMLLAAATGAALFPPIEGVDQVWINRDGSLMAHRFGTKVTVWDVSRRQLVLKIGVSEGAEVGFSPDARRLAVKSSSALDVWDIRAGTRRTAKLQKGESLVAAALFSPDGRYLAVLYKNGVALCNPQTLDCTEEMLPHPGVFGAEFSSDGRRLVTATHNDVRVWDVATKRPLTLPLPWDGKFTGVSPDGTTLFGTMNGELYRVPLPLIEDADTERLAGLGEAIAGYRVDRLGVTEPVDGIKALVDLERRCRDVRGPTCQVVRWLRTAEEKRTIAPDSSLSVAEYVKRRRIVDDSSEEWWRLKLLFPNDPAMGPQP